MPPSPLLHLSGFIEDMVKEHRERQAALVALGFSFPVLPEAGWPALPSLAPSVWRCSLCCISSCFTSLFCDFQRIFFFFSIFFFFPLPCCFWIVWWVRQVSLLSEMWNTLTSCHLDKAGMVATIFWVSGITENNLQSSRLSLRTTPANFSFLSTVSQVAGGVGYWSIMRVIVRKSLKSEQFHLSHSMGFPRFEKNYVITYFANHQRW